MTIFHTKVFQYVFAKATVYKFWLFFSGHSRTEFATLLPCAPCSEFKSPVGAAPATSTHISCYTRIAGGPDIRAPTPMRTTS